MRFYLFIILFSASFLYSSSRELRPSRTLDRLLAEKTIEAEKNTSHRSSVYKSWFTGPFFVPSPITMSPKTPSVNPFVAATLTYGVYDHNWSIQTSSPNLWSFQYGIYAMFGITEKLGVDIISQVASNYSKGKSSTSFNDLIFRVGYQFLRDEKKKGRYTPNLRLLLQEIFPIGNYSKLNPDKLGTDLTGEGSFQTGAYIAVEKEFFSWTQHSFNLYFAQGFIIPSLVHVRKQSFYGGNQFTNGKVYPGVVFSSFFSGEVELTKHLNFAWDVSFQQNLQGRFSGIEGAGQPVNVGQVVNLFIAPELEILFNDNMGLLIAPWATIIGQNTLALTGIFLEFVATF